MLSSGRSTRSGVTTVTATPTNGEDKENQPPSASTPTVTAPLPKRLLTTKLLAKPPTTTTTTVNEAITNNSSATNSISATIPTPSAASSLASLRLRTTKLLAVDKDHHRADLPLPPTQTPATPSHPSITTTSNVSSTPSTTTTSTPATTKLSHAMMTPQPVSVVPATSAATTTAPRSLRSILEPHPSPHSSPQVMPAPSPDSRTLQQLGDVPPTPCISFVSSTTSPMPPSTPSIAALNSASMTSSSGTPSSSTLPTSFTVHGKCYTVLASDSNKPLGEGGSSIVLKVSGPDGAIRALKVMPSPLKPVVQHVPNYQNEIDLLKLLSASPDHGAIIPLVDYEVIEEVVSVNGTSTTVKRVYILMELGGPSLHDFLASHFSRSSPLPLPDLTIRAVFYSMCQAVSKVHAHGIAHFDLKPSNFVVANLPSSSASPSISRLNLTQSFALIDFGIAKKIIVDSKSNCNTDDIAGTLNYMAPECIPLTSGTEGPVLPPSFPADIWSLGVILYQILYQNKLPFHATNSRRTDSEEAAERMRKKKMACIKYSTVVDPTPTSSTSTEEVAPSSSQPFHIPFPFNPLVTHDALDLLKSCLQSSPSNRPTIQQILQHPYFSLIPSASSSSTPPILPPAPVASTTSLPSGSFVVTLDQLDALIGDLQNSVLTPVEVKKKKALFLKQLKTNI